jgi:ligand-binding SRPBCC domain-containing protein
VNQHHNSYEREGRTMALIELETEIRASPARCFDLSRDIDLHQRSMATSGEQAIGGRTSGLIGLSEQVTWCARHFGVTHVHTAKITAFERPDYFRDEMVSGRFASFVHDHHFDSVPAGTRMRDIVEFRSPLGPIGAIIDALVLERYLRRLLTARSQAVRAEAERGTGADPSA